MTRIELRRGDITEESVDAIVNAANPTLLGGGGVDGAIHARGGPSILAECREIRARIGDLPTGEAVATTAGDLDARFVIHTVGPIWRGGDAGEPALLRRCYDRCLALGREKGVRSIAFPSISTGIFGYPIELAAPVALGAALDFAAGDDHYEEIRFVLYSEADLAVYERTRKEI